MRFKKLVAATLIAILMVGAAAKADSGPRNFGRGTFVIFF